MKNCRRGLHPCQDQLRGACNVMTREPLTISNPMFFGSSLPRYYSSLAHVYHTPDQLPRKPTSLIPLMDMEYICWWHLLTEGALFSFPQRLMSPIGNDAARDLEGQAPTLSVLPSVSFPALFWAASVTTSIAKPLAFASFLRLDGSASTSLWSPFPLAKQCHLWA